MVMYEGEKLDSVVYSISFTVDVSDCKTKKEVIDKLGKIVITDPTFSDQEFGISSVQTVDGDQIDDAGLWMMEFKLEDEPMPPRKRVTRG